ncbi:MAG TPA: heparinase II/III-family protein, partial [Kineosporiaceae bacterium]|nr:heparinase II/III-family protein [Kineosporiaceae bacterium]
HDGVELLVDPGTYCYHGEPEWRQYFRSTVAHNTLELGGCDQAEAGGPFLWTTHPRTSTVGSQVGDRPVQTWAAEHDGYQRLDPPAVHRREVALDSPGRTLTVLDTLLTTGEMPLRLMWHLGPDVSVQLDGANAALTWSSGDERRRGQLLLPASLAWTAHRGSTAPVLGWYSPGFARRVPSTSLVGIGTGSAATRLVTTLEVP